MDFRDSIPYIIHEIAQYFVAESDQILSERFGIGFSQYKVMLCAGATQGAPQKHIASALSQTEASVSRQVGILIDKNLVEIGPAKDNRQHLIYLTPRGEEIVLKASNVLSNYNRDKLGTLSEKDLFTLNRILLQIKRNT